MLAKIVQSVFDRFVICSRARTTAFNGVTHLFATNDRRGWSRVCGHLAGALADEVRLAPTYVGQTERGPRNPTLDVVERSEKVLGMKPLDLLQ